MQVGGGVVFTREGLRMVLRRLDGVVVVMNNPFPPRAPAPRLSLERAASGYSLGIAGMVGGIYRIEDSTNLSTWNEVTTYTSTAAITMISLEPKPGSERYFRVTGR